MPLESGVTNFINPKAEAIHTIEFKKTFNTRPKIGSPGERYLSSFEPCSSYLVYFFKQVFNAFEGWKFHKLWLK